MIFPPTPTSSLFSKLQDYPEGPAMSEFVDIYFPAVRRFIGALVQKPEVVEDLTQKFFVSKILPGKVIRPFNREEGRFHNYLQQAIRNFLKDEHWGRNPRELESAIHPDGMEGGWEALPGIVLAAVQEDAFLMGYLQGLVSKALEQTRKTCREKRLHPHFELLEAFYFSDPQPTWRDLGSAFNMDERTARNRAETAARHFKTNLKELVARETRSVGDVEEVILGWLSYLAGQK
jgi:DNA-directed RNA polymerase specialized sigma24 family protein